MIELGDRVLTCFYKDRFCAERLRRESHVEMIDRFSDFLGFSILHFHLTQPSVGLTRARACSYTLGCHARSSERGNV